MCKSSTTQHARKRRIPHETPALRWYLNRVAWPQCPAQTPSCNVFIYFWVGLNRACTIWSSIMHLKIGRASPSAISCCPFKLSFLDSNIACVTIGESSCLPPSSTESNLYWRCYSLRAIEGSCGILGARHTIHLPHPRIQMKITTNTFQPMPGFILFHDPKHFVLFLNYNNFNRFLLSVITIQYTSLTLLIKCCYIVCVQVSSKPFCLPMSSSRGWQVFHLIVSSYLGV
jgi:hypothetical protein